MGITAFRLQWRRNTTMAQRSGSLIVFGQMMARICILGAPMVSYAQSTCRVAKLTAGADGGTFESFGRSVAISGDTAMVGAQWDRDNGTKSGSAYVFRFDGTRWPQTQKLLASDGQSGDVFGRVIAIDGETALIGALGHLHGALGTGAVYVVGFDPNMASWIEQQELHASDGAFQDHFGTSVSISGDVAVIGASQHDDNGPTSGSAYIFRFDPATSLWVEEQKLLALDGAAGDFFGHSVAISGDVALIGANQLDPVCGGAPAGSAGAAYVFRFNGSTWTQEQKLLASDCAPLIDFGESVSISGNVALIGARFGRDDNGFQTGAAYVFRYDANASVWVEEQKLLASDGQAFDQFGRSVAMDGDTAVVGAWVSDSVGPSHGAAYVFGFDGLTWVEQQTLLPDPGPWTAFFGFSVAVSGDTAVIGAHGEDHQAGSAYVFSDGIGIDCNGNGIHDACDIQADPGLDCDGNLLIDTCEVLGDPSLDCNDNFILDSCDVANGTSLDVDVNGIPDECECLADLSGNGVVDFPDRLLLLATWGLDPGGPPDYDGDGVVAVPDLLTLLAAWGACS